MASYQASSFIIAAVLLQLALIGGCTSWVYTAPRALAGLAGSASASSPSSPAGLVIADLRSRKAEELTKQVESLEDSGVEEDTANEASPSLLKKKIGKILTKLRLIAQLKNAYHYKPEESDPEDTTMSMAVDSSEAQPTDASAHVSENIQQIPAAAPPIQDTPIRPLVVDLQVSQIDDKLLNLKEEPAEKPVEEARSPLRSLGVFFAELLGSIVGLTYGAVAQISAGGQSPVTISTSEGL
uniref:Transmembrane protein n=1 Tax=Dendroctonus ponderosae TaxID=77166 RepID=A0AAR5Q4C5_DENPD